MGHALPGTKGELHRQILWKDVRRDSDRRTGARKGTQSGSHQRLGGGGAQYVLDGHVDSSTVLWHSRGLVPDLYLTIWCRRTEHRTLLQDRKGGSSVGVHSGNRLESEWGTRGEQRDLSMWQHLSWTL